MVICQLFIRQFGIFEIRHSFFLTNVFRDDCFIRKFHVWMTNTVFPVRMHESSQNSNNIFMQDKICVFWDYLRASNRLRFQSSFTTKFTEIHRFASIASLRIKQCATFICRVIRRDILLNLLNLCHRKIICKGIKEIKVKTLIHRIHCSFITTRPRKSLLLAH